MLNTISALIGVFGISLISLLGLALISLNDSFLKKITTILVSLAAGTMIATAFIHLIPESLEIVDLYIKEVNITWIFVLIGIITFLILEKLLNWHHCHKTKTHDHKKHIAINNLLADGLHNFIDGIIIGGAFSVDTQTGFLVLVAVALHEIPQEVGDFGILLHSGYSRAKALTYNFFSASIAILGTIAALVLGEVSDTSIGLMSAFAAGSFIYISLGDLVPEIKDTPKLKNGLIHIAFVILGIISITVLTVTLPHEHEHAHEGEDENEIHQD